MPRAPDCASFKCRAAISSSSAAQAELSIAEGKRSWVMLEGGDLFLAPAPSSSTSTEVGEQAKKGGGGAWEGGGGRKDAWEEQVGTASVR